MGVDLTVSIVKPMDRLEHSLIRLELSVDIHNPPAAQGADGGAGPGAASPQPRGGGLLRPQPRAKPPGGRLVLRPSLGTGGAV